MTCCCATGKYISLCLLINERETDARHGLSGGRNRLEIPATHVPVFGQIARSGSVDAHETPHNSQGNDSPQAVLPVFTHPISVSVSAADLPPTEVAQLGNIACPSVRVWRKTRYP